MTPQWRVCAGFVIAWLDEDRFLSISPSPVGDWSWLGDIDLHLCRLSDASADHLGSYGSITEARETAENVDWSLS